MERIEDTILRSLLYNEEFARKTLPFLKDDYFNQFTDKAIFQEIKGYFNNHSNCPPAVLDATGLYSTSILQTNVLRFSLVSL